LDLCLLSSLIYSIGCISKFPQLSGKHIFHIFYADQMGSRMMLVLYGLYYDVAPTELFSTIGKDSLSHTAWFKCSICILIFLKCNLFYLCYLVLLF